MSISLIDFSNIQFKTLKIGQTLNLAVLTDANKDGKSALRKLIFLSFEFNILLDALMGQYTINNRTYFEDQLAVYKSFEGRISTANLNGHFCLLRFICETQNSSMNKLSFLGNILATIFTPKEDSRDGEQWVYASAANAGKDSSLACNALYGSQCPYSVYAYFENYSPTKPSLNQERHFASN